ncbi:YopT-type cysteine protease domain-containing protein [Candidatus Bathycorpusculum sp.]|jgi:hypothetical protein|uniref:YopT-type cysteine protease domain-containing protein n=1 Tax=Candidatus Bathycorpusculum sp. TaxID=2994959 RepID=UPI002820220F|nr:C58 family peptidase [Candidatus Termitimicrobium sp.]MCL2685899.1 C58 family peptidase [Candidatus Termitimicrobium sp.]
MSHNVNGITFYGNPAKQSQNAIIQRITARKHIAKIETGMCLGLAVNYILKYLTNNQQNPSRAHIIFDELTDDTPVAAKNAIDMAEKFGKYRIGEYGTHADPFSEALLAVPEMTNNRLTVDSGFAFVSGKDISIKELNEAHLIVYRFVQHINAPDILSNHALALVKNGETYFLYDPNYGLHTIDDQNLDQLYANTLDAIYTPKNGTTSMKYAVKCLLNNP